MGAKDVDMKAQNARAAVTMQAQLVMEPPRSLPTQHMAHRVIESVRKFSTFDENYLLSLASKSPPITEAVAPYFHRLLSLIKQACAFAATVFREVRGDVRIVHCRPNFWH